MKVTHEEYKYCQLQLDLEGSQANDSAEHETMPGVYRTSEITETKRTDRFIVRERLLEKIIDKENVRNAMNRVIKNKGSHGIDGMSVDELRNHLNENWSTLRQSILDGTYRPQPVRRVEIPKDDGKKRKLGIPTVTDRVIQQAIAQVLSPIYEPMFSDNSYGFRPRRNAHQAMKKSQEYIQEGYQYAVDMDLEKYFDTVNHSKLIQILSRTIKDGRVISLIHKYLRAGIVVRHRFEEIFDGVPQGGPLSPLLSNIMLNELDWELERRGHKFIRYADDLMIFLKSMRSAERVKGNVITYIEKKLFLKVNREKTSVESVVKLKFLGFGYYYSKDIVRLRVHPKSVKKMRTKVRFHTQRSGGISNEERPIKLRRYIQGWVNYFRIADMKVLLRRADEWMRRRIRMIYWKQWKKVKTRYDRLKLFGLDENKAWEYANTRKGYWRISNSPVLAMTLTNDMIKSLNYIFFSDYYETVN